MLHVTEYVILFINFMLLLCLVSQLDVFYAVSELQKRLCCFMQSTATVTSSTDNQCGSVAVINIMCSADETVCSEAHSLSLDVVS